MVNHFGGRWSGALAVALLALAACSPGDSRAAEVTTTTAAPTTTTGPSTTTATVPGPPVAAALGDSLLFEAGDELALALPGLDLRTHAVIGLTTGEGQFGLRALAAADPAALVVVLGTNDSTDGVISSDELAALDSLARLVSGLRCVRWVEVSTSGSLPGFSAAARTWNEALRRAADRYGFQVVPWAAQLAANPRWMAPDGVHHSPEGQAAFAGVLAAALDSCLTAG